MCTSAAYTASRLAVKYSPPTLFLEYTDAQQQHKRVRAVKLSYISYATDLDSLTRKVIKGFPRGLDHSTVNTQQVRQLLRQLLDCACQRQEPQHKCGGSQRNCNSGHGAAVTHRAWDAQAARAACSAATTGGCQQQQQQQQQPMPQQEPATSQAHGQQPKQQDLHVASCLAPATGCGQQEQQCSSSASNLQQQGASSVSNLTPYSQQQQQQQQQEPEFSTSGAGVEVNSCGQQDSNSTQEAATGNVTAFQQQASTQAAAALPFAAVTVLTPAGNQPACSGSSAASSGGSEDGGGDCLVLDPEWVMPDGGEVDLNKVSDYELRLAKAQMTAAFQQNQLKPGDPGYLYDKQADFAAARGSNDWDE